MSDKKIGFLEKIKKDKKLQIALVVILSIVTIFILFKGFINDDSEAEETFSVDTYVTSLENRLEKVLKQVDGAGKVSVVITVESGMETVLAMKTTINETSNGREIEESPIVVNGKTVTVKECYPKIVGVLIVAEGADNLTVFRKIQQATVSLLDINVNQVEILTMK